MVPRARVSHALRSVARDRGGARCWPPLRSGAAASRLRAALKATANLAIYPVLAIVAFFFHSWFTTGAWFVTGGFFVPDNVATGNVWKAFMAVVYGMRLLIGTPLILAGARWACCWCSCAVSARARTRGSLVVLALVALMALPAYAFFNGHPFRMRYMVAPSVGAAVFAGIAVGMLKGRWRQAAAAAIAVWLVATVEAARRAGADGAGSAVGRAFQPRPQERDGVPDARIPRRAHPREHGLACALHAGALSTPASTSATSCTKAPCPTGRRRLRRPRDASDGSWSRSVPKAATCWPDACANRPRSRLASPASCADGGVALYKAETRI